jgi:protein involved in polysaccharide export with SLBB domain
MSRVCHRLWEAAGKCLFALLVLSGFTGCHCIASAKNAVPAYRLPPEMLASPRSPMVPVNMALLRLQPPPIHLIGPRDVLGVYVQDVVPSTQNRQEPNVLQIPVLSQNDYYPPRGVINSPAVGLPMEVTAEGTLTLPLIKPLEVEGLTLPQVAEKVRRAYSVEHHILEPGRERILISLIRSRVTRVLVIRDDVAQPGPTLYLRDTAVMTRRGTGHVIDLPAYENDVLHALAITGGYPGVDAFSAVWVFRNQAVDPEAMTSLKAQIDSGTDPQVVLKAARNAPSAIRIPLRMYPDDPLPFNPDDIVLQAGDVVYLESRQKEFFWAGGLLPAGMIPLPRDYDLDVLGAISLANGAVAGPAGGQQAVASNYRGSTTGDIISPTRVLILRTLANGEQVQIRVDLKKAMSDQRERVLIAPGDVVMLLYKPYEVAGNALLNIATLNVTVLPSSFLNTGS